MLPLHDLVSSPIGRLVTMTYIRPVRIGRPFPSFKFIGRLGNKPSCLENDIKLLPVSVLIGRLVTPVIGVGGINGGP